MTDSSITQIVTFVGVMAGLVFQYLREGRAQRWRVEDEARREKRIVQVNEQHESIMATVAADGLRPTFD